MRTGSATARTTGRRTWLFCAAWLSIWPRWSPQKRRSRVSSSAPDGITPTWSPSSPKPQKAKCDSPARQGRCRALTAHAERGSPTWHRSLLNEGPVIGTALDNRVHHAGHLDGDCGQRLAPQVGVVPIACDGALELVAKAVLLLTDRHLTGEPQGPA